MVMRRGFLCWYVGWALVVGGGCAQTDLGAPCHLLRADNTEASPRPGHTIVQSGSGECDEFLCASFEGAQPVCTTPCSAEGDACAQDWVCVRAILGADLLQQVRERTQGMDDDENGVDDYESIAGGLEDGGFICAPP